MILFKTFKRLLLIVGIPVILALLSYAVFRTDSLKRLFTIMSISFILLVPFGIGVLTIYFSSIERVKSLSYRLMMPWVVVMAFFCVTFFFGFEGWACWLMIMPVFFGAASLGGWLAGRARLRKHKNERLQISLLVLLPFLISPVERYVGDHPSVYKAYTYIDIDAGKADIWNNVTRVRGITSTEDKGWLTETLGFPRPIRAELNYNGVGGYRKAIFNKGLIFHEQVTNYTDQKFMRFTIKANPHEIPSTTMDEHVVIGGNYFDVIDGTYELEKLNDKTYRLHLYSHFKLTTTFNFYAGLWAGWIMKDIQHNILQVIKHRAEDIQSDNHSIDEILGTPSCIITFKLILTISILFR